MTSRPSRVAARASTCAQSWTPWPPMPVMSSSRSMAYSCETEHDEAFDLLRLGATTVCDCLVHDRGASSHTNCALFVGAAERVTDGTRVATSSAWVAARSSG